MQAKTKTPADEKLQQQTHLVRTVEDSLSIAVPDAMEIRFIDTLLLRTMDDLDTMQPGFINRLYHAACKVGFPSKEIGKFRLALQIRLARVLNLEPYKARRQKSA